METMSRGKLLKFMASTVVCLLVFLLPFCVIILLNDLFLQMSVRTNMVMQMHGDTVANYLTYSQSLL